jgi:multiple sugar transport system permease protein
VTARAADRAARIAIMTALTLVAVLFLLPIAWWVSYAVRGSAALVSKPLIETWIPSEFQFSENLARAFDLYPLATFFVNSVLVSGAVTVAEVILASMAGYAFARFDFPGRNVLFVVVMAMLMVPQIVLIVPLFELVVGLQLSNTLPALIIPFMVSPFGVFLMRQFMGTIPREYFEAARVEGAGEFRIFATIGLPLARNAALTLAIFTFLLQFDSLLWPLVATSNQASYTLAVGVSLLQTNVQVPYNAIYAATLTFSLPVLFLYLILQRQFMRSLSFGGLK